MEKEPDSMATVQMKPEYAASEVYSTGSEAPPAYKHHSNSVKIAKIIALTVIASSFIIGSFILASVYLQAKASCDQMQALDSVLEKELMLETLQQELPKAEALLQGREISENDLQNLEKDVKDKKTTSDKKETTPASSDSSSSSDTDSESDSSFSDSDESGELNRVHIRLPLELDLSELANAILENNQKSRMNCVIERRQAEEFVDAPAKTMQLPFGVNLTTEPKRQRVTGERMAIFCESGSEPSRNEQAEQIPQFMMPAQRYPIPFGATPQQFPLTHMPHQMGPPPPQQMPQYPQQQSQPQFPPQFLIRQFAFPQSQPQSPPQQHPMMPPQMSAHPIPPHPQMHQMPPHLPVPDQIMQAPRPEQPEVRIQLQRIPFPIRSSEIPENVQILREIPLPMQGGSNEMPPQVQVQRVPLSVALQRAGITPDDLRNIQRMAEERIQQELRHLAAEDGSSSSSSAASSGSSAASSGGDSSSDSAEDDDSQSDNDSIPPQILQMGRAAFGRSLVTPVRIPVNLMQQITQDHEEVAPADRPHFVQPRSVRSVNDEVKVEKRAKRYACECLC